MADTAKLRDKQLDLQAEASKRQGELLAAIGAGIKMSTKHLGRYVNEFSGRFNQRPLDTAVQMECMARGLMNKRLRYKDLIQG